MAKKYNWHDFYEWSIKNRCDDCGWEEDKRPCEDVMYVRFGDALFYQDGEVHINIKKLNIEKMKKIVAVLYDKDTRDIEEVLAPVPSYDHFSQLVKKVERLEKQLEIATKALKRIDPPNINFEDYNHRAIELWEIAYNALKEMEGVK